MKEINEKLENNSPVILQKKENRILNQAEKETRIIEQAEKEIRIINQNNF